MRVRACMREEEERSIQPLGRTLAMVLQAVNKKANSMV